MSNGYTVTSAQCYYDATTAKEVMTTTCKSPSTWQTTAP
jgi:hypothetical protein